MGIAPNFDAIDSPELTESTNYATGGFVNNLEPHLLSPDQLVRLLNIDPTVAGRRQRRLGVEPMGSPSSASPNGIFPFDAPLQNVHHLFGIWGSSLFSTPGDDSWIRRASGVSFADTLYDGHMGRGRQNLPTLYLNTCVAVTDNASLPYGKLVSTDSTQLPDVTGVTELDVRPRAVTWFQSRLWGFNSGISGPDYLFWSAPLDGRNFENGQNVQVGPDDGDVGVGLTPMRDGTPRILLFKERSIHQLEIFWTTDGYYPTTANALDFTKSLLRPIALNTGCVGTKAFTWTPGQDNADLLFLSREGIRSLQRSITDAQGGAGKPLSFKIQPTIDRINWAHADRSVAAFWNDKAYFSVPVDGSVHPNLVIAYDINRQSFYEFDFKVGSWAEQQFSRERRFFFQSNVSGTETGLGSPASGVTNGFHVYKLDSGQVDPFGAAVEYDEQGRAFSFDTQEERGSGLDYSKQWSHLDLQIQSSATHATLLVQYKVDDDDDWSTLSNLYINPEDSYPYLPIQLPFAFSVGTILQRSLMLRDVRHGSKIQFRLRDTTSYARYKIISLQVHAFPENPRFGNA